MTAETLEAKLEALKPKMQALRQRFDEATTNDERSSIRKEAEELIARAAIQHLVGKAMHQLLATFGGSPSFHSGGKFTAPPLLPLAGCADHEFVVPKP